MKTTITRTVAALAFALVALTGSAQAAKLYSAPLPVAIGQSLECKILNTSEQPRKVRIDIRTDENGLASDMLMPPTTVQPGQVLTWSNPAGPCFGTGLTCIPSWCRFQVQGSKNLYRASACVRDAAGWCRAVVEAR